VKLLKSLRLAAGALALTVCSVGVAVAASVPIKFNPKGTGDIAADIFEVQFFDWSPGNAVAMGGVPAGGLATGNKVTILAQSWLSNAFGPAGGNPLVFPSDRQFTFVSGFGETATCATPGCTIAVFAFDPAQQDQNYFEMWVKTVPPVANDLEGTGFASTGNSANNKRILLGKVTSSNGSYVLGTCLNGLATDDLDLFGINNWPGQSTVCGSGATQIEVQVLALDANYFPGFGPTQIDTIKLHFNTSTVTPYRQADPARRFVADDAGFAGTAQPQPLVVPVLGAVNGQADGTAKDFQFQSDANQSAEFGEEIPGACRVTYGGNDRNGNTDPAKFGGACMKLGKGNTENCYTFGGQVGAPTANPALGGPFGEHTHHQVSGPAGDFVFHAGTRSSLKSSRIEATACKDPGACSQAVANASFKQIDFEGTGSFRTLSAEANAYLKARNGGVDVLPDHTSDKIYWFRVDMVDSGEPGNKTKASAKASALAFLTADQNRPLSDPDPLLLDYVNACNDVADVYQFYICPTDQPCEENQSMYAVRAYLTGGNIQMHKVIK
jgi:hypothetical protein